MTLIQNLIAILGIFASAVLGHSQTIAPNLGEATMTAVPPMKTVGSYIVPRNSSNVVGSSTVNFLAKTVTSTTICFSGDTCRTTWPSGGAGTPGGSNTQVQYNNDGAFSADAGLTYTSSTANLRIGDGVVTTPSLSFNSNGSLGFINNSAGEELQFVGGAEGEAPFSIYGTPILVGGEFRIDTALSGNKAILNTSDLSGNQTFAFPDSSGTLCLTATCGGGGSPGGNDKNIQYNDGAGGFAGDDQFVWDPNGDDPICGSFLSLFCNDNLT